MRSPHRTTRAASLPSEPRSSLDDVVEGVVEWHLLNMAGELITIRLADTIGPGLRRVLRPHWNYDPNRGDGVAPIPHMMSLAARHGRIALGTPLQQQYRIRLVTTRPAGGALRRAHLVMHCTLAVPRRTSDTTLGSSEIWMALTRPYAAPGEHRITEVPAGLGFLAEHPLRDTDLGHRPIESFRCTASEGEELFRDTLPLVYHMDRSDSNLHINMHVYPQQALDYLALSYHRAGGDAGRLRFRTAAAYFRRPFLPGDVAEVEIDLVAGRERFRSALRFYHVPEPGRRSERISMAMEAGGILCNG